MKAPTIDNATYLHAPIHVDHRLDLDWPISLSQSQQLRFRQ
ncbi:MAG TPA: hypothetical protein VMM17_10605 [Gemmatimonadaceae bacterium]|nr:hypothetical protein [Gemmatimonadaceae bacterium]